MNSATASKVHPGPTFRGGPNVWTAGEVKERGRSGLCGHGWCVCGRRREEEGGRGREGSVIQDLFCLSLILGICFVAVCLDVFRHFHRTRKMF